MNENEKYNNIFLGILIGFFVTLGIMWYTKGNKSDTWWCGYLPYEESNYCTNLYMKAMQRIENMPQEEMPPLPL
jgi:hypothetical protein